MPLYTLPNHFIKFKESVYEGYENFSFNEVNYEITEKDIRFIESLQLDISVQDLEKVIDVFEKIVEADKQQSLFYLQQMFYEKAGKEYEKKIPKQMLEIIYQKYWKNERENRKRSFLRSFWEKADFDDTDQYSAFRKRQKGKMNLRKKPKYELDSYFRMFDLRKDSTKVLKVLQNVYTRDSLKKSINYSEQKQWELNFENMMKEKGINLQANVQKGSQNFLNNFGSKTVDQEKFQPIKGEKALAMHIKEFRDYHERFRFLHPSGQFNQIQEQNNN